MSTSSQIQSVRRSEERFPADVIRNGKQFYRGYRVQSESVRKLREMRRNAKSK